MRSPQDLTVINRRGEIIDDAGFLSKMGESKNDDGSGHPLDSPLRTGQEWYGGSESYYPSYISSRPVIMLSYLVLSLNLQRH